ncbi:ATP-binding protein [Herbiconiux sp. CPCC 205763]|uniref:ATP-binding protein n=1 Tax=Herbiconiux aconitum TaxID=2970913 RepID=A0ABT2GSQ8_9MICO|nr:ATP-binding protein [Herbiconiux aconitum]MCS5717871.1 ATP-binding protein [Herbiconiux aconitum]
MQPSPYTPGDLAREVPGRAIQLAEFEERLSYLVDLKRLVGRIRVDNGPRGYGKTSLLRQYQTRAEARGAITVWVTAGEEVGLIAQLADAISRVTASWRSDTRSRLRQSLQVLTLSVGIPGVARIDAAIHPPVTSTPSGAREFEDVVRMVAAADEASALVILIDEIQAADASGLRTLAYAWQHLQAEGIDVPAAVFAAGLPNSPDVIASAVTFSERIAYRPLHPLSTEAGEIAILEPSLRLGVQWNRKALASALEVAAGYPYTLQLIADGAWLAAERPDPGATITEDHVRIGRAEMQADLEALFRGRWANATAQEQQLMSAMAHIGDGPVRRADIARRMGVTAESLGVPRARLIDKGFIQAATRGSLEFTIPGFAVFLRDLES